MQVYEAMLRAQRADMEHLTLFPVVVAASAAGGVLSLVLSPFELIKVRRWLALTY